MAEIEVRTYTDDGEECWERVTDEEEVLGVRAFPFDPSGEWTWEVGISAAEFIRDDPLESEFRDRVGAALRAVPGVDEVAEEDREIWILSGTPAGRDLVLAVSAVLDDLADRIRTECLGEA